jgi:hypothetical protein
LRLYTSQLTIIFRPFAGGGNNPVVLPPPPYPDKSVRFFTDTAFQSHWAKEPHRESALHPRATRGLQDHLRTLARVKVSYGATSSGTLAPAFGLLEPDNFTGRQLSKMTVWSGAWPVSPVRAIADHHERPVTGSPVPRLVNSCVTSL